MLSPKLMAELGHAGIQAWQLMRDPAGLLLCVVPDPPGTLNEGNAHRWE